MYSLPLPNMTVGVPAFALDTRTGGNQIVDHLAYALHADLHADCERLRLGHGRPLKLVFEVRKVMYWSF
jgi:hypothetical protein